jgi:putative exporter of polyketide antibiotics
MVDVQTGKKKWLTVDNAEKLAALIRQGMAIWGTIRGGTGSQTVQGPMPNPNVKTNTSMGINPMLIYGGVAVAIVAIALVMSKK